MLDVLKTSTYMAVIYFIIFNIQVRDLAHAVNTSKHMIDGAKIALDRKRQDRFEQGTTLSVYIIFFLGKIYLCFQIFKVNVIIFNSYK